tara:strand:- start:85 stop:348 length:264 start_codon:yes stop_codon:yes gene_type:complete
MGSHISKNPVTSEEIQKDPFVKNMLFEKSIIYTKFNSVNNKYIKLLKDYKTMENKVLDLLLENSDLKAEIEKQNMKINNLKNKIKKT